MLTHGAQDLSREWFSLIQERMQRNLDDFGTLTQCRSHPDFLAFQSKLARDNLERSIEDTRRFGEVATRVANDARQTLTTETNKSHRAA